MARRPFDRDNFMRSVGVTELGGETGYSDLERIGIRPTLNVKGVWGGFTGEGT